MPECGITKRDGTTCVRDATVPTEEKGLICCRHYAGYRSRGTVKPVKRSCVIGGCESTATRRGLCGKHRMQVYEFGELRERTMRDPNETVIKGAIAEMALYDRTGIPVAATLFDAHLVPEVSQYKWRSRGGYAYNSLHNIFLHALIMGEAPEGKEVDHVNRDPLDNRRQNLRFVTRSQNLMNTNVPRNNTSGTKGVCRDEKKSKWRARIGNNGGRIHLGRFNRKEDAIAARKASESKHFGEHAPT